MSQPVYDVIIVGAGMFGSSAARHLSCLARMKRILLIGPEEPKDKSSADIFSAHYDEARITRRLDPSLLWARLGGKAEDYRELETDSGVDFFNGECGYLQINLKYPMDVAKELNIDVDQLKLSEAKERYPDIHFRSGDVAITTAKHAGYINPRGLIRAQQTVAKRNGCDVIDDVVDSITPAPPGGDLQVMTGQGRLFLGRRVLLATGAFTECRRLLPPSLLPDMFNSAQNYLLVEISEEDYVTSLRNLPSISIDRYYQDRPYRFYILPPVRYPNGQIYMKIGHGEETPVEVASPQEIRDWYRGPGNQEMARHLARAFHDIFPGIAAQSYQTGVCVTSHTPSERPYIEMVQPNIGVALGGNGRGAKASDKIGLIAAKMILRGEWDHQLPKEQFKYRTKPSNRVVSKL